MDKKPDAIADKLDPNQILIAEYNYIAQSAFQTNEDRARYVSFYVMSVGSLIAGIFSSQLNATVNPAMNWAFVILFLTVAAIGLLTILQLVRLRLAWFDSVQAMNQIKRFYRERGPSEVDITAAFAWTDHSLPHRFKARSISFTTAIEVAILAGINAGSAIMWMGFAYGVWWWVGATTVGLLSIGGLLLLYVSMLDGFEVKLTPDPYDDAEQDDE